MKKDEKDKEDEEDNLLSLPLYYYRYKINRNLNLPSFKNKIKDEIKIQFKKIDLDKFLLVSKYLSTFINIKDLKHKFEYFPLELLSIEIKKDEENILIKFEFKLDIYKDVFFEEIKGLLKIENIKLLFILNQQEEKIRGKNGIDFEDIIIEQFWNNTFNYIYFTDKNKIKIDSIYSLKDNKDRKYNIEHNKPIIIRQKFFISKYYDLLLILEKEQKNYGIFIQISINKRKNEISTYYNNIYTFYDKYKKGIECLVNEKIEN